MGVPITPTMERLNRRITRTDSCWIWTGAKSEGYGYLRAHGKRHKAHNVVYRLLVGPIPDGLELDHTCRNPSCVRPDHLEPVTHQENVLRGTAGRKNRIKTHCPQGHPYDDTNTYKLPTRPTARYCTACNVARSRDPDIRRRNNEASRRYRQRKKVIPK